MVTVQMKIVMIFILRQLCIHALQFDNIGFCETTLTDNNVLILQGINGSVITEHICMLMPEWGQTVLAFL